MLTGFYSAASGVLVNQKNINIISNNLVNSQTPGYRASEIKESAFEKELMMRSDSSGAVQLGDGKGTLAVAVGGVTTSFEPGKLQQTGRKLDMAISGDGFFNVQGSDGNTYYTRNGSFTVDDQGYLQLEGIGRVQGQNGDIAITSSDINVGTDGTIKDSSGNILGQIMVSAPSDYSTMTKSSNGMYTSSSQMNTPIDFQVLQGNIELSNADMNSEMTKMMSSQRALQNCASALKTIDTLNQKAAASIASAV